MMATLRCCTAVSAAGAQRPTLTTHRATSMAHFFPPVSHKLTAGSRRRPASHLAKGRLVCRAGKIEQLNAEQLEAAVQTREKPLIIDFYADWCGPCKLMAQELEKVAEELGDKVRIVKVDTEAEPELSTQLQIQGLPTLVFVGVENKPALRTEGLLPALSIKQIIEEEIM